MFYLFFYFVHLKSARGIIMSAVVLFSAILIFAFNFKRIRAASPPRAYDHGRSPFLPFHGRDLVVCFRRVSGASSWPPWLTCLGPENLRPASRPPPPLPHCRPSGAPGLGRAASSAQMEKQGRWLHSGVVPTVPFRLTTPL